MVYQRSLCFGSFKKVVSDGLMLSIKGFLSTQHYFQRLSMQGGSPNNARILFGFRCQRV